MDKNYVQLFVEAVYPGNAELALASFNERQCLEDATARINEMENALRLTKRNLETLVAARHCDEVLMRPWLEVVTAATPNSGGVKS